VPALPPLPAVQGSEIRTRKRPWKLVLTVFVVAFLVYGCFVPRLTVDGMRHKIAGEIPVGTPRSGVEQWVKERDYEDPWGTAHKVG
jgi:hypothetical protein